ncbi:MAG: hypothetical protein ABI056_07780 [Caulobacteraceae bacterium]
MTVRTITGVYSSGYSLSPAYTGLVIASSAKVYGQGVYVSFTASVTNYGHVVTSGHYADGVHLKNGGAVTNGSTAATGATITGYYGGVVVKSAAASIANFGTISSISPSGGGIYLGAGGAVTNGSAADTVAAISGGYAGLLVAGGPAEVTNYGMIQGGTVAGVELRAGGSVTNGSTADTGATIAASEGVGIAGGVATIANFGTISGLGGSGLGVGVGLGAGGTITNGSATDVAATIYGKDIGLYVAAGSATVTNFGTITRSNALATGIQLNGVGSVTNGSTADTVARIVGGVTAEYAAATIANDGTISGGPGGAVLFYGGAVTNGSAADGTATISGNHAGVYVKSGGATVTNFGTIIGTGGPAVEFVSAVDTLVVEAGCVFTGAVLGGGGTLDLATGVGTLTGLLAGGNVTVSGSMAATIFSNFGTVEIGAAATFASSGPVTIAAGQSVIDAGSLTLGGSKKAGVSNAGLLEATGAGTLTIAGKLANNGTLSVDGQTLKVTAAVTGTGVATIGRGILDFTSSFNESVTFTGTTGVLELAQSQTYTATIAGFSKRGRTSLDLADIGFVSSGEATYSGTKSSGVLTITDGTHTAHINLKGNYLSSTFTASSDGHGGTVVVYSESPAAQPPPHQFIAEMAGLGASAASLSSPISHAWREPLPISAPRTQMA